MTGKLSKIIRTITLGIFVVLIFYTFWRYINPVLINYTQQPLFLFDKYFLYKYLVIPGGIAAYLSLFISQFFISKIAGSLLLTLIIFLAVLLSNRLLRFFFSKEAAFYLSLLPGLIMIHLHSHYKYNLQGDIIFLTALIFALAYIKSFRRPVYVRFLLLLISDVLLFFLCGGTSLLLYCAIIVLSEIKQHNDRLFWLTAILQISLCLVILFVVPLKSPYVDFKMAYLGILCPGMYYKPLKFLYTLYIVIPFLLLIAVIIKYIWHGTGLSGRFAIEIPERVNTVILLIVPLFVVGILILVFRYSYNRENKDAVLIHYYAANNNWRSVLKTADNLSTTDRTVLFQINRALYHLNRLPDQAFNYAQYWGEHGLILTTHYTHDVLMFCSDLYFDMGHIKESLHWAYEAQTKSDQSPDILKRIVTDNIILGDYVMAEKFLRILSKSVLHRKWARHYWSYLNHEGMIQKDKLIMEKRRLMPREDFFVNTPQPQYDLLNLLSQQPANRMAFEYFMLYSLFTHDLSTVADNIKQMERYGYEKIPVHFEEAIMLVMAMNPEYPLDLGKYRISEQTKKKFLAYSKILMKHKRDRVAAQSDLFQDFGNTYWYYIHYVSPITTNRKFYGKTN